MMRRHDNQPHPQGFGYARIDNVMYFIRVVLNSKIEAETFSSQ